MRLNAENISFRYPLGRYILRNVNFYLNSGEVVGLTAPSGFGKTTLARILSGYEEAETGRVTIDGMEGKKKGYHPVQMVFQHPEKAVNPKWKMRKILEETGSSSPKLMEAMGIQPGWLDRWPSELSGGELQRFCVLRVLNGSTRFLIADEMTTMLDAITQAQIWKTVLDYSRLQNIGVTVISHDRALIGKICDRAVELSDYCD